MSGSSSAVPRKDLKEWHTPSTRTEVIDELIHGVDRYNPSNLSYMEEYLQQQVQDGEYDPLANLAILKLYQFNPQMSNPEVIVNILIKALSGTVHGPDFNLCMSLLREPSVILSDIESDEQSLAVVMPFLSELHHLIRSCQFSAFWAQVNGESEAASILKSDYLPQHLHLISQLRFLFARSVASCFSRVRLAQLARWLDLPQGEVAGWCESAGWTVDGENAVVPGNGDNDVKATVVKEHVELNQLTKLVAAAAV